MGTYDIIKRMVNDQETLEDLVRQLLQVVKEKQKTDPEVADRILDEMMVPQAEWKEQFERLEREFDA